MIIRKIDEFQFEIDGEAIAATKKAKIVGDMIYLDDIFKNEVVIKIPFDGLQINGKTPADLNAAVIMLNRFVGSFKKCVGTITDNGNGTSTGNENLTAENIYYFHHNIINIDGAAGNKNFTAEDIPMSQNNSTTIAQEITNIQGNINALENRIPPAFWTDCTNMFGFDNTQVTLIAKYFNSSVATGVDVDEIEIFCVNSDFSSIIIRPSFGFGAMTSDGGLYWVTDSNGNQQQIIFNAELNDVQCEIYIPGNCVAKFSYKVDVAESPYGRSYIETNTGFYPLEPSDFQVLSDGVYYRGQELHFKHVTCLASNVLSLVIRQDITNDVTGLNHYFCYEFTNLSFVDLYGLANIKYIGDYFFGFCLSLPYIDVGIFQNVLTVGTFFLSDCINLRNLDLSGFENVKNFGTGILWNAKNIDNIEFGNFDFTAVSHASNQSFSTYGMSLAWQNGVDISGQFMFDIEEMFPELRGIDGSWRKLVVPQPVAPPDPPQPL